MPNHLCPICKDSATVGAVLCHSCPQHQSALRRSLTPVYPLAFFSRTDPLRDYLHHYKDDTHPDQLEATHALDEHIATTWPNLDLPIVVVPSTKTDCTHLAELINNHFQIAPLFSLRATQHAPERPRVARPTLFTITGTPPSGPVLLVDDAYVTGSTAQSAAHTLTSKGVDIAAIVALGRRINPEHAPNHPHTQLDR